MIGDGRLPPASERGRAMAELGYEAWLTIAVLVAVFSTLVASSVSADIVMMAGLVVLLLGGVLSPKEALSGMSNEGMITVAVLYVVVAGLQQTGCMALVASRLFGRPTGVNDAQVRMMLPVATISGFMNNTPLVAMMLPVVNEWAKKFRIPVGKLMMPLSFATILGGLCTMIGTSTNVISAGLLRDKLATGEIQGEAMGMFTITWVGLPVAIAGIAYMLVASRWLLPDRKPAIATTDDPRQYTVEMMVDASGPIVGQTIEEAGLRHLASMYLAEVDRRNEIIAAVSPTLRLEADDRLVFVGVVDSVRELQRIRGLSPATSQVFKLEGPRWQRILVEAVVSDKCPVVGKTVREGNFRKLYNAVIVAVGRGQERLQQKIGDIELRAGDVLLLEARAAFVEQQRNSRDFYLVSALEDSAPTRHHKAWTALAILAAMIVSATVFEQAPWFVERDFSMLHAALLAAGLMFATGCCSVESARRSIDFEVLLLIASAFGIGKAMEKTGVATSLASSMLGFAQGDPFLALVVIYAMTMLMTELLSNNTAVTLMFPIMIAATKELGVDYMPFLVAITVAASCGFATPIGYQTNLMVYGPGGYRFSDFLRFGGILNLIVWLVTMLVLPQVFDIGRR
jgi:di/tricarboxylate transporter